MSGNKFMALAAAPMAKIIANIRPDQLGGQTPCAEYDVRKLVNHLLFWGPSLEGAGRKNTVPPPAATETEVDLTEGDWAAALEAHLDRTVTAWSEPGAWNGITHMADRRNFPHRSIDTSKRGRTTPACHGRQAVHSGHKGRFLPARQGERSVAWPLYLP